MAKQDAQQRMAHDAIGAHARDGLGVSETLRARPIQAALASAGSFAVGAAMPLAVTALAPVAALIPLVSGTSLAFLALLGGLAARRWRRSYDGERNGHVLGRTSDGADCRRRGGVRNSRVSVAATIPFDPRQERNRSFKFSLPHRRAAWSAFLPVSRFNFRIDTL